MRRQSACVLGVVIALCLSGCSAKSEYGGTTGTPAVNSQSGAATSGSAIAPTTSLSESASEAFEPVAPKTRSSTALHTPAVGDSERKAILDALRVPVEKDLRQRVTFKIGRIAVQRPFAYVSGQPLRPNGHAINYRKTRYAAAVRAGAFDDGVLALLRFKNGSWKVIVVEIGATDFPGEYWIKEYGAPRALLGY